MNEGKCCQCDSPATFDCPSLLCDEHWADWWVGNDPTDLGEHVPPKEERERWKAEVLQELRAKREQEEETCQQK